ncbi:hypothetical protein BN137_4257 [Cronobacter condimenti 1330]|uniref:Uncharacterized protein n=1 Tax=Cronobacter condimenti 1330 TaxID=1073999 RepID=K8AKQ7_9ENTR|nr:hypothetical protein BN137_4257 [Cronobacter condimenti 1330]
MSVPDNEVIDKGCHSLAQNMKRKGPIGQKVLPIRAISRIALCG